MIVALVGQPNAGRSTLFNAVAGYRTLTANYPGTTLEVVQSRVTVSNATFELLDLPGIYGLSTGDEGERLARDVILSVDRRPDIFIQVIDATVLGRSLELTLELLEARVPLVVCLNRMDEAERKGIHIDVAHLAADLGVSVVPTIASRGHGVVDLFRTALAAARDPRHGTLFPYAKDVETAISEVEARIPPGTSIPPRFLAVALVDGDDLGLSHAAPDLDAAVNRARARLEEDHGRPADVVIASERHALALNLFEHVAVVRSGGRASWGNRIDEVLMHPVGGLIGMAAILLVFFSAVFTVGQWIEAPVLAGFAHLAIHVGAVFPQGSLALALVNGLVQGFSGGVGIVLPYLVPFLVGLGLLEDSGYIPRAAFLADGLMHRMGLHGKSILPFVLGYGCTVGAILGTRMLENRRDRVITAVLVNFIPCAARTTILFAVAGAFLGPVAALGFFGISLAIIGASGAVLARVQPHLSPGLVLEIPPYRMPGAVAILRKTWFRMREFVVIAWPVLIVGSVALSLLEHFGLAGLVNRVLAPFTTGVLGLPEVVGTTLIFGVLRKELSVVMLVQALGTADFSAVMSPAQIATYTAFAVFYVPCLATLAMLRVAVGTRTMLVALAFTTGMATLVALLFRIGFGWVPLS